MKMRRGIWDVWRRGRKASVTRAGPGGEGEGEGGFQGGEAGKGGGHPALLMRTSSLPCWASIWAAAAEMEEGKVTSSWRG